MSDELQSEVRQTVADVFALDPASVTDATSPETTPAWDSIGHLNLILAVEQQFGVSFDPDRIPKLTSIQALADEISARRG
jgi:acyl carrier protein